MASKQKAPAAGKRKAGKRKAPADRLDNRYNVNLGPETDAALQRLVDTTGLAAGVLLREAIDAGLSGVRDRYRKRGA